MTTDKIASIRARVQGLLEERGDRQPLLDTDSLFFSGRLDSLAATHLMMLLEETFGIDLAAADFDVTRLDSLAEIEAFVSETQG
ncbi:MAG: phosphopantetheine-binding protein [Allorhizobium sp.]|jgi:acyl carrier protein|uniref:Acyl carrier protein n=1 Tax=Rhizobium rosettiformans TaxID=1368430 RepID=A0ABX7ERU4_9HYPH|nr:acyl carrier protein [Rhizobium rosettiformans]QRF50648.1 acyl carrier protein [Rhizobium rosettiformans]